MSHTRTRLALAAGITTILLTLGACGDEDNSDSTQEETSTPADDAQASPEPTVIPLGQTYTYDDGLTITVKLDELFTPNDYGNFDDDSTYAMLSATITNGTGQPLAIDSVFQDCTVSGTAVPYEGFQDVTSDWPDIVTASSDGTWKYACAAEPGADIQAQMQINDRPAVYFDGTVPQ